MFLKFSKFQTNLRGISCESNWVYVRMAVGLFISNGGERFMAANFFRSRLSIVTGDARVLATGQVIYFRKHFKYVFFL